MPDRTTRSLTRPLLKTTGFMLVSMVCQTLDVLIDPIGLDARPSAFGFRLSARLAARCCGVTERMARAEGRRS